MVLEWQRNRSSQEWESEMKSEKDNTHISMPMGHVAQRRATGGLFAAMTLLLFNQERLQSFRDHPSSAGDRLPEHKLPTINSTWRLDVRKRLHRQHQLNSKPWSVGRLMCSENQQPIRLMCSENQQQPRWSVRRLMCSQNQQQPRWSVRRLLLRSQFQQKNTHHQLLPSILISPLISRRLTTKICRWYVPERKKMARRTKRMQARGKGMEARNKATCNAIGQMCKDFVPIIQKKCHECIVPALLAAMSDLSCSSVAAHAAAAMVNFSEDCPKSVIAIYLPPLIEKLESVLSQTFQQLMTNGKNLVLKQVITTIASVADAAQDQFAKFYTNLKPPLKYIFENAKDDNLKMLRGKTIDLFGADADYIMQVLLASGLKFESNDDPQIGYFIAAWTRICKILGEKFAKYLDLIMPIVLAAADFKPDVQIVENAEENEEWDYVQLDDDSSLGIRTTGIEDKVTACEMLVCFARELKEHFGRYVEMVLEMMLPMLKFIFHDGVRSAAAECLPCLMVSAKVFGDQYVKQMWGVVLNAYKEAIDRENDLEVLCEMLNGIAQCVEDFGTTEIITSNDIEQIYTIAHEQILKFEKRRMDREKKEKSEEMDDEDQEQKDEILELETSVLSRISDVNHYLILSRREALIPFFDRMVGQFASLLDQRRPYQDRQWDICIFDDLIEYGGKAAYLHYQNFFFQPMINALGDKHPEVRQAAAYGFGVLGKKGDPDFSKQLALNKQITADQ